MKLMLVCAVLVLTARLDATLTVPTDLPDVARGATTIVRGRVVDTRAFVDVDNGPAMTAVTIRVATVLKGDTVTGAALTFRVHGGDLGRYSYRVVGAPTFAVGDEAYFFLKRVSTGALWPVGMAQGIYRVSASGPTAGGGATPGARVATAARAGAVESGSTGVVTPPVVAGITATADAPVVRGDVRRVPMAATDFESIVRRILSGDLR